jgi:chemotaxis signal transduction protein
MPEPRLLQTTLQLLTLPMGQYTLGIPIENVVVIQPRQGVIPVPCPRQAVEGLLRHAQKLIPLISLGRALAMPGESAEMVVVINQGDQMIAFAGSSVDSVIEVGLDQIEGIKHVPADLPREVLRAVVRGIENFFILNLGALARNWSAQPAALLKM